MIFIFLASLTLIFFASLVGYKKLRSIIKNKVVEWLLWTGFSMWTLGFAIWGMSFINSTFSDANKVLAVVPVALGSGLFFLLNRKNNPCEGF